MLVLLCVLLLGVACGALAWIDFREGIIPDGINLAIAALGALFAVMTDGWPALAQTAAEAVLIGLAIWLLRRLYFMLRKVQGLGLGDVKLLAASTLWVGAAGIPVQLLVASASALLAAAGLQLAGRAMTRQTSLPFGPFLALGLLSTLALQQTGWLD